MVLESPYYGSRRPAGQEGSRLLHVSDLLVLGRATIEESLCLLDWSHRNGFGKLGESFGRLIQSLLLCRLLEVDRWQAVLAGQVSFGSLRIDLSVNGGCQGCLAACRGSAVRCKPPGSGLYLSMDVRGK